ncbi:MAG: hypothetical protein QM733_13835 [Ilumatobacteraceae bacterium]
MAETTTIRVSRATRDEARMLAEQLGVTTDVAVRRALRRERQRLMAESLAQPRDGEEQALVVAASRTSGRLAGR